MNRIQFTGFEALPINLSGPWSEFRDRMDLACCDELEGQILGISGQFSLRPQNPQAAGNAGTSFRLSGEETGLGEGCVPRLVPNHLRG